jgi:hypothetical protein
MLSIELFSLAMERFYSSVEPVESDAIEGNKGGGTTLSGKPMGWLAALGEFVIGLVGSKARRLCILAQTSGVTVIAPVLDGVVPSFAPLLIDAVVRSN